MTTKPRNLITDLVKNAEEETDELITTISYLLNSKFENLTEEHNREAIFWACLNPMPKLIKLLLRENSTAHNWTTDSFCDNNTGLQPMHVAARYGQTENIIQLLSCGANINARTGCNSTALMWAANLNQLDTVKLLIDRGADMNLRNNGDYSAVDYAIDYNFPDVVKYLISQGVDVEQCNKNGQTLLHFAADKGSLKSIEALLDCGADINSLTTWNSTPLMYAAQNGNYKIVSMLVDRGADVSLVTSHGKTARDYALSLHVEIASYLKLVDELNSKNEAKEQTKQAKEELLYDAIGEYANRFGPSQLPEYTDSGVKAFIEEYLSRNESKEKNLKKEEYDDGYVSGEEIVWNPKAEVQELPTEVMDDAIRSENEKLNITFKLEGDAKSIKKLEKVFI